MILLKRQHTQTKLLRNLYCIYSRKIGQFETPLMLKGPIQKNVKLGFIFLELRIFYRLLERNLNLCGPIMSKHRSAQHSWLVHQLPSRSYLNQGHRFKLSPTIQRAISKIRKQIESHFFNQKILQIHSIDSIALISVFCSAIYSFRRGYSTVLLYCSQIEFICRSTVCREFSSWKYLGSKAFPCSGNVFERIDSVIARKVQ